MSGDVAALSVRNLSRSFGGLKALDDVSLEVGKGEALGLVGPNGSGKTTLVNVACGLYPPTHGRIFLAETEITGWKPYALARAGVNRTFQIPKPFHSLSVGENLRMALAHAKKPAPEVRELLERTRLGSIEGVAVDRLTASQQKRLDLARALALDPSVLFVDELAAGLTPVELREVAEILKECLEEGRALVVVEHLLGFLELVVSSVIVLSAGRAIFQGELRASLEDVEVKRVFLGRTADS
ncbi:MAG: ABC transporter ATP-binding protein [Ferrimicrobium sp.]